MPCSCKLYTCEMAYSASAFKINFGFPPKSLPSAVHTAGRPFIKYARNIKGILWPTSLLIFHTGSLQDTRVWERENRRNVVENWVFSAVICLPLQIQAIPRISFVYYWRKIRLGVRVAQLQVTCIPKLNLNGCVTERVYVKLKSERVGGRLSKI